MVNDDWRSQELKARTPYFIELIREIRHDVFLDLIGVNSKARVG